MKNVGLAVCALFLCGSVAFGQSYSRPTNGFVLDKTSTISGSDKLKINEVCRQIKSETNGEIMVAIVPTTNGQNPRQFATKLFNQWNIGHAYSNRGVLVFVAINDRKAEVVLGDGIDSAREETIARSIMSDYMMPKFKQRKPSAGTRISVEECAKQFFRINETVDTATDIVTTAEATSDGPTNVQVATAASPQEIVSAESDVFSNELSRETQVATVSPEPPVTVDQPVENNPPQIRPRNPNRRNRNDGGGFMTRLLVLLGGGASAGGAGFGFYRLATARRRPRNCERCSQPMMRLDEVADDAHLNEAERLEEKLGSVDYDVWVCSGCDHAQKLRYGAFFTRYSKCPSCGAKTASSTTSTIRHATTMSTGLKEVEEVCESCDYHRITEHVIPRVVESNHASSNFSSGGGGGGGSFGGGGGGTSSGGGASGSW